ncbi:ABC transporter permease [Brachybacterium tyrofermentans]|uniref:Transport permease protein n=1 Tax=Brachybacterium tyrofermentans TaxID=47848 RepID=A0ABW0FHU0_9MICO
MSETRTARQIVDALQAKGFRTDGLSSVGARPDLGEYINQLWARRYFIWMDARHRVLSQNSRNRLGSAWLLLKPIMDAAFFFVVFGLILKVQREGIDNFGAYIIIGVLMFRATATSVTSSPSVLASGKAMIRAFSFPRAAIPISAVLRDGLQMIWAVGAMLVMIAVIPPFVTPAATWVLILPLLALQWMMNLGITFILARVGFRFPDTAQLMSFVSRLLMYGSGVIFPIDQILTHPVASAIIEANPVFQMLKMYRAVLMEGALPAAESWMILGGWAAGLLLFGFLFFWRGEASYGDEQQ